MKIVFFLAASFLTGMRLFAQPCDPVVNLQDWTAHVVSFAPDEPPDILNVDALDSNTIWAATFALNYLRSTDGGCTWQKGVFDDALDPEFVYSSQILARDSMTAWIPLYDDTDYKSHLYKTVDGGQTWTEMLTSEYSGEDSYLDNIYFFNASDGILLGDVVDGFYEIYTTTNNGDAWTRVPQQNFPPLLAGENAFSANVFAVIGDTVWVPTKRGGRIFRSTDKGHHWDVFGPPPVTTLSKAAIEFRDALHGLYTSEAQGAWKTADGGATWVQVTSPPEWGRFLENIPGTETYLLTYGPSKTLFTLNEGETWGEIEGELYEIDFLNPKIGWAGHSGQILEWNSILSPTNEPAVSTAWCNVYPNPTYDKCQLNFSATPEERFLIAVFHLDGRLLLEQHGSGQEATVDLSSVPDGLYFLKIVCGQRVGNIPVMKH